jgi:hypothetical protein
MISAALSIFVGKTGYFLIKIWRGIIDLIRERIRYATLIAIAPDPSPTRIENEIAGSEELVRLTKKALPKVIFGFVFWGTITVVINMLFFISV